jgi:hypothetical protein
MTQTPLALSFEGRQFTDKSRFGGALIVDNSETTVTNSAASFGTDLGC